MKPFTYLSKVFKQVALGALWIYQNFLFPLKTIILGADDCCRFYPTCSEYSKEAFKEHGVLYGFYLTLKRLLCCHPWHKGGIDFVPKRREKTL